MKNNIFNSLVEIFFKVQLQILQQKGFCLNKNKHKQILPFLNENFLLYSKFFEYSVHLLDNIINDQMLQCTEKHTNYCHVEVLPKSC